jgi:glucose-6-phosphate 1-dehydrogenase
MTEYERLIGDALDGQGALFARSDGVENSWRVLEAALRSPTPIHFYEPGSWGPPEADELIHFAGGWHEPGSPI